MGGFRELLEADRAGVLEDLLEPGANGAGA